MNENEHFRLPNKYKMRQPGSFPVLRALKASDPGNDHPSFHLETSRLHHIMGTGFRAHYQLNEQFGGQRSTRCGIECLLAVYLTLLPSDNKAVISSPRVV